MRFVVVGAGPAGCAFAASVAVDHDVVIVESGMRHAPEPDRLRPRPDAEDRASGVAVRRAAPDALDLTEPTTSVDQYVCGHGVGGGALVNGGFVVGEPDPAITRLLPIEQPASIGPLSAALLDSHQGAELGRLVARDGRRVDLADHLLRAHDSVEIQSGRTVARVVFDGSRAIGVVTDDGEHIAGDVVVLAAGALVTPTLLLRSGVVTPGIGHRLHDTTSVPLVVELAVPAGDVAPLTVSADRDHHRLIPVESATDVRFGVLLVSLTSATSRGRLTLPTDGGPPEIALGQLSTPEDRRALVAAIVDASQVLEHPAWRTVTTGVSIDADGTPLAALGRDPDRIATWAAAHLGGTYHATATCALACDGTGAVRGHEGLAVVDASVLRATPARNTFLAVISQASGLGKMWRGSSGRSAV